jgi:hypothetical protein
MLQICYLCLVLDASLEITLFFPEHSSGDW